MVNGKREKGLFINDVMESMTNDFGVKEKITVTSFMDAPKKPTHLQTPSEMGPTGSNHVFGQLFLLGMSGLLVQDPVVQSGYHQLNQNQSL